MTREAIERGDFEGAGPEGKRTPARPAAGGGRLPRSAVRSLAEAALLRLAGAAEDGSREPD